MRCGTGGSGRVAYLDQPEATAELRTGRERQVRQMKQHLDTQGGLAFLGEREPWLGVRWIAESLHDLQCRAGH